MMANVANLNAVLSLESQSFLSAIESSRSAAKRLIESLDPAAEAAARFNRQVDLLEKAMKSGQISTEQFALAQTRLKQRFEETVNAADPVVQGSNRMRYGMQNLSFQLNDIATGFASGQKPMQIFAQQSGQVIQAIQIMTAESKGFLGFLAGPWGGVITVAVILLGSLAGKFLDNSEAEKEQAKAADELKSSIDSLYKSTEQQISSEARLRAATLATAQADLTAAATARQKAQARLQGKLAEANVANRVSDNAFSIAQYSNAAPIGVSAIASLVGVGAGAYASSKRSESDAIQKELEKLKQQEAQAKTAVAGLQIINLRVAGDISRNRVTAATAAYQAALDKIGDAKKANRLTDQQYEAEYVRLTNAYEANTKTLEANDRATGQHHGSLKRAKAATLEVSDAQWIAINSTEILAEAMKKQSQFLDRLFPDEAQKRKLVDDANQLGQLLVEGVVSPDQWLDARARISEELDAIDDRIRNRSGSINHTFSESLAQLEPALQHGQDFLAKYVERGTDGATKLAQSYADAATSVAGSLNGLANSIRGGDILSILGGVADLIGSVVGAINAFGGHIGPSASTGKRAEGGPVIGGTPYLIGERGPELFVPNQSGSVISHETVRRNMANGAGFGGGGTVRIVPSAYFDVVVDRRAQSQIQRAAPEIAVSGASGAITQLDRRRQRALA